MKELLKRILKKLPFKFTKNQEYDSLTNEVLRCVLKSNSICIDVGCHKGEILDLFLRYAKGGRHYAFEPIPELYKALDRKYGDICEVYNYALSNTSGETTFNYVVSNPAYSGLRKRDYKRPETIKEIKVQTEKMDNILPWKAKIDLIKIDVEGAEQWVLEGAKETITRNQPVVIFEHGLGASEHYNSNPTDVYNILLECGLKVSTMDRYLGNRPAFKLNEFINQYNRKLNYYFIAYP
ncbi:MAG: FkbM family methyltransferase [Chitinophagaceae bacterium]|nr:FkbM family methyltransferase [Chitinophagaceae bacterium]